MAGGTYWGKSSVLCPFYVSDNLQEKKITCEWIVPKSTVTARFLNKSDYRKQLIGVCGRDYESCPVYRALMKEKYGEEK